MKTWVLVAVIVVAATVIVVQMRLYDTRLRNVQTMRQKAEQADSTYFYKDQHKRLFAYSKTLEVSLSDAKRAVANQSQALKTLAAELDRSTKMVAEASVILTGKDVASTTVANRDSVIAHDTICVWPVYAGVVKDSLSLIKVTASRDSIQALYSFKVPILVKQQHLSHGLFKPAENIVAFYTSNPHAQITQVRSIAIPAKVKRWGLGFNLNYSVTPAGLQPGLGVGLHYDVIQW